jgi:GT2 family glycosyltransferase
MPDIAKDLLLRFSVIVPVYNRADQLRQLFVALSRQTLPRDRFEVVISDDGSEEDLVSVVREATDTYGLQIVYIRQPNRGPGAARNLGLARARGEIAAFTDSDCEPVAEWLEALDRAFVDRDVSLAGGPVSLGSGQNLAGRTMSFLISSSLGGGGTFDPRCAVRMEFYPRTLNLAVRREVALAVGGFPGNSYGEDLEFGYRVTRTGARPAFVVNASVVHHEQRGLPGVFLKNLHKGAARIRLRKTCLMHESIHMLPAAMVASLVGSALIASLWPEARIISAVPWAVYALALIALGVQGAFALREPRALAIVPCYALMIHLGYGLGYLGASLGLIKDRPDPQLVNWDALRTE